MTGRSLEWGSDRHVFRTRPSEGECGAESVSVTRGSDPTRPAISCDHGHVPCRMSSHPTWTQLLTPVPRCHLRLLLQPSGCMFLLFVIPVSKTSPDRKKGMPVLTCLSTRVSEGPIRVRFSTESHLHWTCLLAYGSHINLTHQLPSGSLLRLLPGKLAFLSAQKLRALGYGSKIQSTRERDLE